MATQEKVTFDYDEVGDVLYISLGTGEPSYAEEIDDLVVVEKGFFSDRITGFRLIGIRFHKIDKVEVGKVIVELFKEERAEYKSMLQQRRAMQDRVIRQIGQRLEKHGKLTSV